LLGALIYKVVSPHTVIYACPIQIVHKKRASTLVDAQMCRSF